MPARRRRMSMMEGQVEEGGEVVERRGGGVMIVGAGVSVEGGRGALRARRLGALIVCFLF